MPFAPVGQGGQIPAIPEPQNDNIVQPQQPQQPNMGGHMLRNLAAMGVVGGRQQPEHYYGPRGGAPAEPGAAQADDEVGAPLRQLGMRPERAAAQEGNKVLNCAKKLGHCVIGMFNKVIGKD